MASPEAQPGVPATRRYKCKLRHYSEGRVYGGGLHKVEPKELGQIPARLLLESIDSRLCIKQQESLFAWGNKKKGTCTFSP